MEKRPCPPEGCELPRCFEDVHHIYRQADADTPIKRLFCNLPENKVRICRMAHMLLERTEGWPEYPEVDVMKTAIQESGVYLSRNNERRINGTSAA